VDSQAIYNMIGHVLWFSSLIGHPNPILELQQFSV